MNYRDTFSKFEASRQLYSHKTQVPEQDNKKLSGLSPRMSTFHEKSFKNFEKIKEKPSYGEPWSPDSYISNASGATKRNMSSNKSVVQIPRHSDIEAENKSLKEKVANLQRERDIIKNWKKARGNDNPQVYKEKLNFLVKNIQKFLHSSLKFQSMLREKMGVNVANMYEEERNFLKSQVVSATQDYDIPFKYSPMTSPLRGEKSPRIDEFSSIDSETTRILEELRNEKAKNKKLQNELTVEMALKDEEMKNIRDRLIELENIEKGKTETDKLFARSKQVWENEKKDLGRELEKLKSDNKKMREKLNEFEDIYNEMKEDNLSIKSRCEEMIQENFKLSESLQTYDRLYNYSKKWAEKAVDEARERAEETIKQIQYKFEATNKKLEEAFRGLDKVKKSEFSELVKEKNKIKELEQELIGCYEKVRKEEEKYEDLNEKFGDALNSVEEYEDKIVALEQKLTETLKANEKYEILCDRFKNECQRYQDELKKVFQEKNSIEVKLFESIEEKKIIEENLEDKSKEIEEILTDYQTKLKLFQEKIEKLGKENDELNENIGNKEKRLEELNIKLVTKDKKICELNEQIEEERKNLLELEKIRRNKTEIEQENEENSREIGNLIELNNKLSAKIRNKESELEVQLNNFDSLKKQFAIKEKELENKSEELELLQKSFALKDEDSKELSQAKKQFLFMAEKITKLEDQTKVVQLQNLDLVEKLTLKDKEVENLQNLLAEQKELIKIKEKSLETLKFSLNDYQNLINTLNSKEQYIQKIEEKAKNLSDQLTSSGILIESLQNDKNSQSAQIKDLQSELNLLNEIPKLQEASQKQSELLEISKKHSITLEKLLKEKEDQLKIKESKLKDLDSQIILNKQLTEKISTLTSEARNLADQLNLLKDLPSQIKAKDQELESLKKSLDNDQEFRKKTKAHQENSEKQEKEYKEKIEVLKVKLDFLQSEKEKLISASNDKTEELARATKALDQAQGLLRSQDSELSLKETALNDFKQKTEESLTTILSLQDKLKAIVSEHEEATLGDKEEISRLNSALVKSDNTISTLKKENSSLSQTIISLESKKSHCENCELQKQKISELECVIHSAEESLGGFYNNSLIESISNLISAKSQNLRKAPRPPLLRSRPEGQKRQSEELRPSIAEELINKSPMITEGSKRSHSSAFSMPDISDLRNELNEEKSENEKYLNQIRLLKEDIRELERKLKRSQDLNEKINSDLLTNTLVKLVRALPVQNNEVESIISLIFSIISLPKEELVKLEPERRAKTTKKFGVF